MALLPWRTGKVVSIINETSNTRRFLIEVPELDSFEFIPGQFVTLDLPIDAKPNKRLRSYSIASWPDGTNRFELVIVLDKLGAGTHYIFNEVKEGSELRLRGPLGVFKLKQPLDKDVFLICTGTGIAPFRSMINTLNIQQVPHHHIYLIFGCRSSDNILYQEEMTHLQQTLKDFTYIPVLSREQWEGETGYVHAVYEKLCRDKRPASFYLCGWKGMVDEAHKRILEMGYDVKDIHAELYG